MLLEDRDMLGVGIGLPGKPGPPSQNKIGQAACSPAYFYGH
jgi:hypothetical protein